MATPVLGERARERRNAGGGDGVRLEVEAGEAAVDAEHLGALGGEAIVDGRRGEAQCTYRRIRGKGANYRDALLVGRALPRRATGQYVGTARRSTLGTAARAAGRLGVLQ
eukprot:1928831-Pleurochrysis_carterae.AAC.1